MRGCLAAFFYFLFFGLFSQSYVDSGVRHFNQGEYREALADLQEAEKVKTVFTELAIAKLHFYHGVTLYKLQKPIEMDRDKIYFIKEKLDKAIKVDSTNWFARSQEVYQGLADSRIEKAEKMLKEARKQEERELRVSLTKEYIFQLNLSEELVYNPDLELLKAEAYHEVGDLYFEDATKVSSLQEAAKNYQKAIELYEIARYNDPFSKEIIRKILMLSKRMDDPERIKEYSDLLELAGG